MEAEVEGAEPGEHHHGHGHGHDGIIYDDDFDYNNDDIDDTED